MSPNSTSWMSSQAWTAGYQPRRRGQVNPNLRVSDAERADVADRLSKHYGDGRLDQAEFNERMERAMAAKTHGDFAGLFNDLPDLSEPGGNGASPVPAVHHKHSSRSPMSRLALIIVIIVAAAVIGHALIHSFFPWILVALVAFLWLRHHERSHHRA